MQINLGSKFTSDFESMAVCISLFSSSFFMNSYSLFLSKGAQKRKLFWSIGGETPYVNLLFEIHL